MKKCKALITVDTRVCVFGLQGAITFVMLEWLVLFVVIYEIVYGFFSLRTTNVTKLVSFIYSFMILNTV